MVFRKKYQVPVKFYRDDLAGGVSTEERTGPLICVKMVEVEAEDLG